MTDSQHNPYAPPRAPVDESSVATAANAPAPVKLAMKLLWISFFLTFVELALDWDYYTGGDELRNLHDFESIFVWVFTAALIVLQVWIYFNIAIGRNWARIVFLVLTLVGSPLAVLDMPEMVRRSPVAAGVTVVDLVIVAIALYLLVFPGRAWFRQRS